MTVYDSMATWRYDSTTNNYDGMSIQQYINGYDSMAGSSMMTAANVRYGNMIYDGMTIMSIYQQP
jgi:hypothetical protein